MFVRLESIEIEHQNRRNIIITSNSRSSNSFFGDKIKEEIYKYLRCTNDIYKAIDDSLSSIANFIKSSACFYDCSFQYKFYIQASKF